MDDSWSPYFLNKWSPSVSLLKDDLSRVLVWVKFHDVPLVAYTSDGLSMTATKIGTPMMLDSYMNSMCLESWGRSSYARILIEIDACNDFNDNLVIPMPNLKGTRYMKETIHVEYEWKPARYSKGGSSGADAKGFVKVKKKKPGGNSNFSLSNSFEALNVENVISEEVEMDNKASTSDVQEEGQSSTPLVEMINMFEKQLLEKECVLVDDDGKPLKKVDYSGDQDSEDETESVDNEMTSYLASKPPGVGNGTKSLLEQ
ncbi:zinc knuckle CX2CX4HX4C containing protein [Tanacetum coccineum]